MASVLKRGPFQFQARVRIKGFPTRTETFESRADAITWASNAEAEMRTGRFIDRREQDRLTLDQVLERYAREVTPGKRSALQELRKIRWLRKQPIAHRTLGSLVGSDFARYRDARTATGTAAATVRLDLALIGHLFEVCRKEWGMEGLMNPVRNIRLPKVAVARERRLHPGEYETILAAIQRVSRQPWLRAAFILAVETSLRQGVLVQLKWSWIDLDARLIRIPPAYREQANKGVPIAIPLWNSAIEALRDLTERHDARVLPFTAHALQLAWKQVKQSPHGKAFRDLRWHDLRHEAASRLTERGLHPFEIQAITGHKSMQMLKRYTHIRAEDLLKKYGSIVDHPQ